MQISTCSSAAEVMIRQTKGLPVALQTDGNISQAWNGPLHRSWYAWRSQRIGACRAGGEASGKSYPVFISHAGPQKASFAVWLQRELRRHGVDAFLDETSLRLGDAADAEMEAALRSCSIVVVVLTPDYLQSSYCMEELHWALHPLQLHPPLKKSAAEPALQQLAAGSTPKASAQLQQSTTQRDKEPPLVLPVFYHTSRIEALQQEVQQQLADADQSGAPSAARQRLQQASADLAEVCRISGDRLDSHGK
jgi:TIR domain